MKSGCLIDTGAASSASTLSAAPDAACELHESDAEYRTSPTRIESPMDHIRLIIHEMRLYLSFRLLEKDRGLSDAAPKKKEWEAARKDRILKQETALARGVSLPWLQVLEERQVEAGLWDVLSLMLSCEVSPACLDLLSSFVLDERRCITLTLGALMKTCVPYMCPDETMLIGRFGVGESLEQKGILYTRSNSTHYQNNYIMLQENLVRQVFDQSQIVFYRNDLVTREYPDVKFEKVILPAHIKQHAFKLVKRCIEDNERGLANGTTLLFYGPSGTGKTMLSRAIAHELGCPLLSFNAGGTALYRISFDEVLPGLFNLAREQRAIVFIDEVDDLFHAGSSESRALLISIERSPCATILATNNIRQLDPALERRFSATFHFSFPMLDQRKDLWQALKPEQAEFAPDVSIDDLAAKYPFTGSQIENALNLATRMSEERDGEAALLSGELLRESAENQFSSFLTQNVVTHEENPQEVRRDFGDVRIGAEAIDADAAWVSLYRREQDAIARFFPARSNRGPVLLILHHDSVYFMAYARQLAARLGYRLLAARTSDLTDLREHLSREQLPFIETTPHDFILTRLVNEETVFLIEDDANALVEKEGVVQKDETYALMAAMRKSPAVLVVAQQPDKTSSMLIPGLIDRVRALDRHAGGAEKTLLERLAERGYPAETAHSDGMFLYGGALAELAALEAYLATKRNGGGPVTPDALLRAYKEINLLCRHRTPKLFGPEGE